jgi:hypothetical protein
VTVIGALNRLEQLSQQAGHGRGSRLHRDLVDEHPGRADDADVRRRRAHGLKGREGRRVEVAGRIEGDALRVGAVGPQVGTEVVEGVRGWRRENRLRRGEGGERRKGGEQ